MGVVCKNPCANHTVTLRVQGREPHARPHFHIRARGWKVSVALDNFEELARSGRPHQADLDEALETARTMIDELYAEWRKCNARD
jgi:hypothetical protein